MQGIQYKKFLLPLFFAGALLATGTSCRQKQAIVQARKTVVEKQLYTCSMHPQIIMEAPGSCPICGMELVKKPRGSKKIYSVQLEDLLQPTNGFVITDLPVTTMRQSSEKVSIEALGNIQNDTRQLATISARVGGRIEKLYVRYRYQMIMPGDKIMDIYSPEIATAQQNLLFLLKNDAANNSLIEAAKQKLLLMGMSGKQLSKLLTSGTPGLTITVYSNAMGHVHEAGGEPMGASGEMSIAATETAALAIREGMYVQAGQKVFLLTNPQKAWAVLNIFPENGQAVKVGNKVKIIPEAMPLKVFEAPISFIEPFYRQGSKTLTARVYFDNLILAIPIGSQVRANIFGASVKGNWLPQASIVSLGIGQIVFVKTANGFIPKKIQAGIRQNGFVQVIGGIAVADTVAANAQYLNDSEIFIKVK